MQLWSSRRSPRTRAFVLAPLLAANLIAALVPALHAFTHHAELHGHVVPSAEIALDAEQHGSHPEALHDRWLVLARVGIDHAFVAPARTDVTGLETSFELLLRASVSAPTSRAPPSGDLPRAPPSA